ncbi:MAG: glucose-6-phosphate dehydrogenase assembly protein OpcA [Armatimonadota bacterium]|nr:glucose-6-phosphate dehydrogenase assembly protein OpcA [Armatimonadota bacterium]
MAQLGQVFPLAEDRSVDLASVIQELRALWQGHDDRDDEKSPATRICLLNLVAVAQEARSASRASEACTAITAGYPCRVIMVTADAHASDGIETSISAYCHPGSGSSKPLCCERIDISASGASVAQLGWAVTPLLAADVPVFIWWQGDVDPTDPLYSRLVNHADRLIVDFGSFSQPDQSLRALEAYQSSSHPAVTDLAWRRTTQWRELVASLFDPPAYRPYVQQIAEVQIGFAAGGSHWPHAQASLLGTWIAERLDWKPQGKFQQTENGWTLEVQTPAGPGRITLQSDALAGTAPGEISSVVFPQSSALPVGFSVRRSRTGDLIEVQIDRADDKPLTWRRPRNVYDTVWLLGQELERPHGSPAFEAVLKVLSEVM